MGISHWENPLLFFTLIIFSIRYLPGKGEKRATPRSPVRIAQDLDLLDLAELLKNAPQVVLVARNGKHSDEKSPFGALFDVCRTHLDRIHHSFNQIK